MWSRWGDAYPVVISIPHCAGWLDQGSHSAKIVHN